MKIVILGPPGSGKGTQAELLEKEKNFIRFSTGDIFRKEISQNSELGRKIKTYLASGALVPDELVVAVVEEFLKKNMDSDIIFDGFPRTVPQAISLDNLLGRQGIDFCIFIQLPESEIIYRLTNRRICPNCQAIYNLSFKPPKENNICDICQGTLIQREDDKEEVIKKRTAVYFELTAPLIEYYQNQNKLRIIDGLLGKDYVYKKINELIDHYACIH